MLLVTDTDDWLNVFDTVQEVEASLEWQDVEGDEYTACDETGRVYEFVVNDSAFNLVLTTKAQADLPARFITRFAERFGFTQTEVRSIIEQFGDLARCVDYIERNGKWQKRRR